MIERKPQADAILLHGYWMSEHRTGLALRSRLAARAVALAYDNGNGAGKIVIDLGHLWGDKYPPEAELMVKELTSYYNVPQDAIISRERAYSTKGEVQTALEIAKQNGWKNIVDVAFKRHHLTIPRLYRHAPLNVDYQSVEEIIKEKDPNPHAKRLVHRLSRSRYEVAYFFYERLKWLKMHMPGFNYDSIEEKNKSSRTEKGREFIIPIDVYKL